MIVAERLSKHYSDLRRGQIVAVDRVSFSALPGEVFGLLGPNGAGKTTTMRMISTLLDPTWGEAYVCGHSIYTHPREIRRMVGYMPDFFGVYDDMQVIEYLEFFAACYRIDGQARRDVCDRVLDLVDLEFKRHEMANTLSRGQTQRLGLARVMLHDPQVLLLDEPASGLDPRQRIKMRELIKRLRDMGKTIMISSHILPELADMCNKVGMIEQGQLIANEDVTELMRRLRRQPVLYIAVAGPLAAAAKLLEQAPIVEKIEEKPEHLEVTLVTDTQDYSELASILIQGGQKLTLFREKEINLETAFMLLTQGISA